MPESTQLRRSRPSPVQTKLPSLSQLAAITQSNISNSSIESSPQQTSPVLCSENAEVGLTTASSVQDSPEPLEPFPERGFEDLTPFQLPDPIASPLIGSTLSRRTSTNSLGQSMKSPGGTAMSDAIRRGIMRRASNKMQKVSDSLLRRRPSSTHPISRDGSVGPGVVRLRRGSNSNPNLAAADHGSALYTDSDDDYAIEKEEGGSLFGGDGASRDFSPLSATAFCTGSGASSGMTAGPVIPLALRQGTPLLKVSKKKNNKRITLVLDAESAKIWWDRNRSSKSIYIDDIKEIRTAEDIRQYRLDAGLEESMESRFFSLLYTVPEKSGTKALHLVADNERVFRSWTEALEAISKHRQEFATSLMAFNDKAIRAYWQREMAKQLGDKPRFAEEESIDFPGVERVCRSLHIHVSTQALREKFDEAKGKKAGSSLNFAEFLEFVRLMKARRDIRAIYRQNAADVENGMTKDEFLHFLRNVQRENVDEDLAYWENAFTRFARKRKPRDAERSAVGGSSEESLALSENALASFLTSTSNVAIPMEPQDYVLDRPMNEYYISSSHNTYLLGRQVAGVSSVEGYISALMRGCRCVEVDCWDGQDDQPVVVHGHTWTTRISFLEVIKTINKYAFVKSRFPLWISLEVRCNYVTQANMAKIMIAIFKEKLVRTPLDPTSDRLPSPSELMERILIKVKTSQPVDEALKNGDKFGRRRGNSQPSPYQRALPMDNVPAPASPLLSPTPLSRSNRQINTINEGEVPPSSNPSECESESEKDAAKKANSKINPVLSDLGVYCVGIHFDGFNTPEAKKFNHIFSFKERTFAEKNQPGEAKRALYRHNMQYLMRVYPNGGRISSTNFDPLIYWKRGVQMAALNWQTFDLGMQLNQAMFDSGTDQSGYVLKPLEGRQIQLMPNLSDDKWLGKRPRKNVSFRIDVISAQQLMRPWSLAEKRTLDPYVEVEVFLADDKRNEIEAVSNAPPRDTQLKYRTKIVRENGFNPEFDESFTFNFTTKYPDLIFVRWSVKLADKGYNDKAPPMATFTAKLSSLKQGYRPIPLLDHNGDNYLFSTLFCHIRKGPVTDVMVNYREDAAASRNNSNKLKNISKLYQFNVSPKSSMDSSHS
ncbi:hypothetical protein QBC46DRAFT_363871 [Diplogelasinospora grovesii]|uniref:Phosphoinositide phospholipase C n=1 Tax=Diplogelasinospora grovesii TaxID=303347 RepID=A0AAN6NBG5_9PEZI|nr:hypothetical protein QBC46DRAFT_363871 [Diplogelasinospora grovesii]